MDIFNETRSHKKQIMRDTSISALHDDSHRDKMRLMVYQAIKFNSNLSVYLTDREITKWLGFVDPNKVRPRRNELMQNNLIEEAGKKICSVSGRLALTWKINQEI